MRSLILIGILSFILSLSSVSGQCAPEGPSQEGDQAFQKALETAPSQSYLGIFGAATTSSFCTAVILYPIELAKQRKQLMDSAAQFYLPKAGVVENFRYIGKGLPSFAFVYAVSKTSFLCGYEHLKKNEGWSPFQAGFTAGVGEGLLSTPLWNWRTRKILLGHSQSSNFSARDLTNFFLSQPQKHYRAGIATLGLTMANCGLGFELYEALKEMGASPFVAGGSSRLMMTPLIVPLEVIRLRKVESSLSYPEVLRDLWRQGPRRFHSGFGFATTKATLSSALSLGLFELIQGCYEEYMEQPDS